MRTDLWIAAVLTFGLAVASCGEHDMPVPAEPAVNPVDDQSSVEEWLAKIPGVSDIRKTQKMTVGSTDNQDVYYFNFEQLVDHNDPSRGTFKQQVCLLYKGKVHTNLLHTQGYNLFEISNYLAAPDLTAELDANYVEVEYRYFGTSLPEPFENLEFNYLTSEQASCDLHAIVTALKATGRFPQKWVATGTSKGGITTAFYAYYSDKRGYDDIDVYVPFVAPFLTSLTDKRVGTYFEQQSFTSMPEVRERLDAIDRALVTESLLSSYILQNYPQTNPEEYQIAIDGAATQEEADGRLLAKILTDARYNLFQKNQRMHISLWKDYIPDPDDETTLDYTLFFLQASPSELSAYIKAHPKQQAQTRADAGEDQETDETYLESRRSDPQWPYGVQAMLELGHTQDSFDKLRDVMTLTTMEQVEQAHQAHYVYATRYPRYAKRYAGNGMTLDFLNRFLPATTKKMVFVYGANDGWTGGAIPDPTNPNIRKIVVPNGYHTEAISNRTAYPEESYRQIMDAIRAELVP